MFKATSTFTQARNIAMALTMTFAATTLTACGNDEGSDDTQSPEAEMSSENQNDSAENTSEMDTGNATESDSEVVAEPDETETAASEPEQSDSTSETEDSNTAEASDDTATADNEEEASAEPETHAVTAQGLKYNPLVVTINPGDTVAWRNMSTHNTESMDGLIPEGAEMWQSAMSENYRRTFTQEGIYVYKCTPHFGAGMGGAIIVGEPVNLEQIKNADASGAAGRLVRKAIAEAESM